MNISSKQFRANLATAFDAQKPWFSKGVGARAFLNDRGYYIPTLKDLKKRVPKARLKMADIAEVGLKYLSGTHSGDNGRNDCDNFAFLGSYIVKAQFDTFCRKQNLLHREYNLLPMARADMPHTQALCLTQDGWFQVVEFITGDIYSIKYDKPLRILKLG